MEPETNLTIPEMERRALVKLMRGVPRRNELRRIIDAKTGALRDMTGAVPLLLRVVKKSGERRWRERSAAIRVLRYLSIPPENQAETAVLLGKIMNGGEMGAPQRIARRVLRIVWRWLLWLAPLVIAVIISGIWPELDPFYNFFGAMMVLYLVIFGVVTLLLPVASPVYDAIRANDVRIEAAKTLAALQLPESVGALARAARGVNFRADIARNALLQLLPTLTETHYGQIGADAAPELCALLTWAAPDTPYMERILAALGKIGDGRAVAPVENFAASHAGSSAGRQAQNILPLLRLRREQENASSMLLRHSSAPNNPADLLRAASASRETPPDQLLRPAPETPEDRG